MNRCYFPFGRLHCFRSHFIINCQIFETGVQPLTDKQQVYEELYQYIAGLWVVDTHEHMAAYKSGSPLDYLKTMINTYARFDLQIISGDGRSTYQWLRDCHRIITDYSSLAGDFMLLNRPAVFFQPEMVWAIAGSASSDRCTALTVPSP